MAQFDPARVCRELAKSGYENKISEEVLCETLKAGVKDPSFVDLIVWVCNEVAALYELEESVNSPSDTPEDLECFLLELSSLINELECPIDALTCGPLMERFETQENRQKLLNFLLSHLRCARLTALDRESEESVQHRKRDEVLWVDDALKALGSSQPPADVNAEQLFKKLCKLAENQLSKCRERPKPLFIASLSDNQWARVSEINERLVHEYHSRMQLLLKRLDVTIQSFIWSDRIKKLEDKVHEVYRPRRDNIVVAANVDMSDLLAATSDLLVVEKVISSKERERTASRLNKVLMAERPGDRGGRPSELRAPPPEMPAWRKERAPDMPRGGGRGGGYSRGRGDFRGRGGRGGGGGRDAGFENRVMYEYEAADRRHQGGGHASYGNQGCAEYGGQGYVDYGNQQGHGQAGYGQRGRGGGYRGGRGGRYYERY